MLSIKDIIVGTTIASTRIIIITLENIFFVFLLLKLIIILHPFNIISTWRFTMKLILPFFLLFVGWFTYEMKKSRRQAEERSVNFWEKERLANQSRRKNVDKLNYITFSPDSLPLFENISQDAKDFSELETARLELQRLSTCKILNLSGSSNTDLKMEYGPSNLTFLSECDTNYIDLIAALTKLAAFAKNNGYTAETRAILEYAINIGSDSITQYDMLADIYVQDGNEKGISSLKEHASLIKTISKDVIISHLNSL